MSRSVNWHLIDHFSSSTQLDIGDLKTSLRNNTIQLDIVDLTKISLRSLSVCQPTADIYWIKQGRINLWFIQVCHSYYKENHIKNKWKKILRNRKFLQCKKHTSSHWNIGACSYTMLCFHLWSWTRSPRLQRDVYHLPELYNTILEYCNLNDMLRLDYSLIIRLNSISSFPFLFEQAL